MRYNRLLILLIVLVSIIQFRAQNTEAYPFLKQKGTATQLILNDEPFLILGGELGNSSVSSSYDIERIFPKLEQMGLNTVLVPAYWDLIEPEEGKYDFTLIEKAIKQARKNNLKVVFLWFGAWKNSMSCYAPLWFKQNYKEYPRTYTKEGKPLEIASPFSVNVLNVDNRAFSQLMKYIKSIDDENTVIMMQIQNEIGMLEDARDYSKKANTLFKSQVPKTLLSYLYENKNKLHPFLFQKWKVQGFKTEGNWKEIFGGDLYTDELFMAWFYAQYVEELAKSGKSIYDIPMYVNASMNSRDRKP